MECWIVYGSLFCDVLSPWRWKKYDSLWCPITLKMEEVQLAVTSCHPEAGGGTILRDVLSSWKWRSTFSHDVLSPWRWGQHCIPSHRTISTLYGENNQDKTIVSPITIIKSSEPALIGFPSHFPHPHTNVLKMCNSVPVHNIAGDIISTKVFY
jgi:hypothetical protein